MAHGRLGQEGSAETDTGILDVLLAYVSQGGHLYGARRWEDNPLTLTHVRWQGVSGGLLDAFRQPGGTVSTEDIESNVWVQLALNFPATHPSPAGMDAPWLPLKVDPATASQWVQQLRASLAQRRSRSAMSHQPLTPATSMPGLDSHPPEEIANPWHRPFDSLAGQGSFGSPGSYGSGTSGSPGQSGTPLDREAGSYPTPPTTSFQSPLASGYEPDDTGHWTGSVQRPSADGVESAVLPCIEVDLPPLLDDRVTMDYHRDFARDVAVHFRQAVQQFREVREVRGWMKGERLVLAARFIVGTGGRPISRMEMDRVARLLADVLAERTLPYAQLGFADPGEWMQGRPLPES
jgi:hypothetical protein